MPESDMIDPETMYKISSHMLNGWGNFRKKRSLEGELPQSFLIAQNPKLN